jgi:soluble lytic murein transglycosylase-like protein
MNLPFLKVKFLPSKARRSPGRDHLRLPGGVLLHGNRIWFSESMSIALVSLIVAFLLWATATIVINESRIARHEATLGLLRADNLLLSQQVTAAKSQAAIISVLQGMTGGHVSAATMQHLAEIVYENSATYGYDPLLVLAVIQVESFFNAQALGAYESGEYSGALGLMQLKPETAQDMATVLGMGRISRDDLFKPHINLALGVAYLTWLIATFKSFKLGLLAYNLGPEVVRLSLANATPLSTSYYSRVLKSYYQIKKMAKY